MADLEWDRNFALEQAGDDEEMLAELLVLFRDSSAADMERIRDGLSREDAVAVADAAHSIKGAAASLGVAGVRRVAAEMEKTGRGGDLAALARQVPELADLLAALDDLR
ncbi:Hpt domain-containing protein [Thiovibrio sp. JS02]